MEICSDDTFAALSSIEGEHIGEDRLRLLLKKKKTAPICYVWFQPSDMMDIEQVYQQTFLL
jgi:tyrosyl-tRNA synthetase